MVALGRGKKKLILDDIWTGSYCTFVRAKETGFIYVFGLNNYNQLGNTFGTFVTLRYSYASFVGISSQVFPVKLHGFSLSCRKGSEVAGGKVYHVGSITPSHSMTMVSFLSVPSIIHLLIVYYLNHYHIGFWFLSYR